MGTVKDSQIGRCKETDKKFEKINSSITFYVFEDSDLDDIDES